MARIAATTTSTVLLSANRARAFATIYNEPGAQAATLYVRFGPVVATDDYNIQIAPGGYVELPLVASGGGVRPYQGVVLGVWNGTTGFAQAQEG